MGTINELISLARKHRLHEDSVFSRGLYHYTSPKGLLGILDHDDGIHLHFTRIDCLNDKSEGKLLFAHFREICKELLNQNRIDKNYYEELINLNLIDYTSIVYNSPENPQLNNLDVVQYNAYVCCFSSEPDSIPMWHYYSKENHSHGYNINFYNFIFQEKSNLPDILKNQIKVFKIRYANQEIRNTMSKMILDLKEFFFINEETTSIAKSIFHSFLTDLNLHYKHEQFQYENEIRAILYIPKEASKIPNYEPPKIEYTDKAGVIIPYIDVMFPNKILVQGATIGPLIEHALAKELLYTFFKDRGYSCKPEDILTSQANIRY